MVFSLTLHFQKQGFSVTIPVFIVVVLIFSIWGNSQSIHMLSVVSALDNGPKMSKILVCDFKKISQYLCNPDYGSQWMNWFFGFQNCHLAIESLWPWLWVTKKELFLVIEIAIRVLNHCDPDYVSQKINWFFGFLGGHHHIVPSEGWLCAWWPIEA